jgi:hypothetical protein
LTLVPIGWCSTKERNDVKSLTAVAADAAGRSGAASGFAVEGAFCGAAGFAPGIVALGGGAFGTGIGRLASGLDIGARLSRRPRPPRSASGSATPPSFLRRASLTALRLIGPRTGVRATNTHPMCGTGLPPISRPSSNSHGYVPWNSWNESFDSTVAPTLFAMLSRNASPRPIAPAGGATSSLFETAASNSGNFAEPMR